MKNSRKYHEIEPTLLAPNKNGNPKNAKMEETSDIIDSTAINSFCSEYNIEKQALLLAGTILSLNKFTFTSKTLINISLNGKTIPFHKQ